jgi:hypothetical protein
MSGFLTWFSLALSHCKLWAVDRQTFQAIMMRAGMQKQTEHLELIKKYIFSSLTLLDLMNRFV